mgnify:CR=1 FL=1
MTPYDLYEFRHVEFMGGDGGGRGKGASRREFDCYKGPRYIGGDLKVSMCISQQAEFVFDTI